MKHMKVPSMPRRASLAPKVSRISFWNSPSVNAFASWLQVGPDLEHRPGPIKAHVELHEEVDLTQDYWHSVGDCPSEGQAHGGKTTDDGHHDQHPCLHTSHVTRQPHRCRLLLPNRA